VSQAEALWESKSQIAELACQDIRYKGPVYQTARLNNNNNQATHNFITTRQHLQRNQYAKCSRYAIYADVDTALFRYSALKNNH
jgi:hypothetical protein